MLGHGGMGLGGLGWVLGPALTKFGSARVCFGRGRDRFGGNF